MGGNRSDYAPHNQGMSSRKSVNASKKLGFIKAAGREPGYDRDPEYSVQPMGDVILPTGPQSLSSLRPNLSLANEIRRCTRVGVREHSSDTNFKGPRKGSVWCGGTGLFQAARRS